MVVCDIGWHACCYTCVRNLQHIYTCRLMPYYSVTVHRTIRIEADTADEAETLAQLFTYYPETVEHVVHMSVRVEPATPDL